MIEELQRTPQTIDFLPERYREARIKRSANVWRMLLMVLLAAMLTCTTYLQHKSLEDAERDLARVNSLHSVATDLAQQMAARQQNLPAIANDAALLTYLRHPWPRSQILQALFEPLPDELALVSLELAFEPPHAAPLQEKQPAQADDKPGAARDLKRLRTTLDEGRTVALLSGTTSNLTALHAYLASLEQHALFHRVELVSIESSPTASGHARFSVRVHVRPAHGQPRGPQVAKVSLARPTEARR